MPGLPLPTVQLRPGGLTDPWWRVVSRVPYSQVITRRGWNRFLLPACLQQPGSAGRLVATTPMRFCGHLCLCPGKLPDRGPRHGDWHGWRLGKVWRHDRPDRGRLLIPYYRPISNPGFGGDSFRYCRFGSSCTGDETRGKTPGGYIKYRGCISKAGKIRKPDRSKTTKGGGD